jgi:hypothetical protein
VGALTGEEERKEQYSKCLRQEVEGRRKRQQNRKNRAQFSLLQPLSSAADTCLSHTKAEIFCYIDIEFWTVGIEMMDHRVWLKIAGELQN